MAFVGVFAGCANVEGVGFFDAEPDGGDVSVFGGVDRLDADVYSWSGNWPRSLRRGYELQAWKL